MTHSAGRIETLAVHGRAARAGGIRPVVSPIVQSATFAADTVEAQRASTTGDAFYTRYGNPTLTVAEETIALLEGAEAGLVFASGMAATTSALLGVLRTGDHLVAQRDLYGGTHLFLAHWLPRLGIEVTLVDAVDPEAFRRGLRPSTRAIFLESPTNPLLRIVDVRAIAALARQHGLRTYLDNTFATPINQRPHARGIDIVIHSGTKYLSGHSDIVCGAVTGEAGLLREIREARTMLGGSIDPHAAWLLIRGLKTLAVRVERQNRNALALARYLAEHPRVKAVHYPFLPTHPQHALATAQMDGGGGVLSFELDATAAEVHRFVERLRVFSLAGSLGGVESLVTIPELSTHAMLSVEERRALGITSTLVRLAVGIENAEDLVADLDQALEASWPAGRAGHAVGRA